MHVWTKEFARRFCQIFRNCKKMKSKGLQERAAGISFKLMCISVDVYVFISICIGIACKIQNIPNANVTTTHIYIDTYVHSM